MINCTSDHDFRQSIKDQLTQSDLFVLFASSRSLASTWVKYEISEAEWQQIHQRIGGALVIIIDDKVCPEHLPIWMKRCLASHSASPAQSARLIQNTLAESVIPQRLPLYMGREDDTKKIIELLLPSAFQNEPRLIVVSGLEGAGRKTFLRHVLRDYLSLTTGPLFLLALSDSVDTLYLRLLDETGGLASRSDLAESIRLFQKMRPKKKVWK